MLFTNKWLSVIFNNHKIIKENNEIKKVFIDSREEVEQGLFVPIVGERFDGHDFAIQAIKNGAVSLLWDKEKEVPEELPNDISIFFVEDTTLALQELAKAYKNEIQAKVIGITGSNGKTTTKDLVATVVSSTYRTHFTDGNFNNHIGLPLTILDMPRDTEVLVLEMGMSAFGEIELLSKLANPNISIITNIGESHIEFLGSKEGIKEAKLEIRSGMSGEGQLIIDGDEKLLFDLKDEENVISCGFLSNNDVNIKEVKTDLEKTSFQLNGKEQYTVSLIGDHHAKNASFAILVGRLLQIDEAVIVKSLQNLKLSGMRFEFLQGKNGATIVNDAYNASPTSMIGAIDTIRSLTSFKNKILVLGDIFELGSFGEQFHREIGDHVKRPITALITYGDLARYISSEVSDGEGVAVFHADLRDELLVHVEEYLNEDTIILFKASRGMEFEQLIEQVIDKPKL